MSSGNITREIYSHTGLRGIAAWSVFMTHLGWEHRLTEGINPQNFLLFNWPDYAVDLFFILSGFILNWVYLKPATGGNGVDCEAAPEVASGAGTPELKEENSSIDWEKYFIARFARILPLYYLTAYFFLIPCFSTMKYHGWFFENGKFFYLALSNLLVVSGFSGVDHWDWTLNGPAWSITIELFAYIALFPALLIINSKISKSGNYKLILFLLTALSFLGLWLCYTDLPQIIPFWNCSRFGRGVFGFFIGFFLCSLYKLNNISEENPKYIDAKMAVLLVLFFLSLYAKIPKITLIFLIPFIVYFSAFDTGFFARFLKINICQWLGERSYSIYLCHTPIIFLLFIPNIKKMKMLFSCKYISFGLFGFLAVTITVLIASELSYRFFERPCRNFFRNPNYYIGIATAAIRKYAFRVIG